MADWKVRVYNKKGEVIERWKILDRTEHEAENEAMADIQKMPEADDWTLTEI